MSASEPPKGEAGSDAERRVAAPEPSWMARQGPEPLGTLQCQSPPRRKGGVQSLGHMEASEPSLSRGAGYGAAVARASAWAYALPFILA
jgi:hypothetical protein